VTEFNTCKWAFGGVCGGGGLIEGKTPKGYYNYIIFLNNNIIENIT
jgi:hypothetical protein